MHVALCSEFFSVCSGIDKNGLIFRIINLSAAFSLIVVRIFHPVSYLIVIMFGCSIIWVSTSDNLCTGFAINVTFVVLNPDFFHLRKHCISRSG